MVKKRREKEKKSDQQGSKSLEREFYQPKKYIECIFQKMGEYFSIYFKFESILILKFKPLPNEKKRRPSNMVKKRREKDGRERDQQGSKSVLRALSKEKYIECIYMGKHFSIYFKFDRILISKRIP